MPLTGAWEGGGGGDELRDEIGTAFEAVADIGAGNAFVNGIGAGAAFWIGRVGRGG